MRSLIFALCAVAMVFMLSFAVPGVNFYHHLSLPDFSQHKIQTSYSVDFRPPFLHKNSDIYLEDGIHKQMMYTDILELLVSSRPHDTITFHLSGYGGDGQTMEYLINNIRSTKAYVIMSVEAPVFSAHAYMAMFGNELRVSPYSFLMFHFSSVLNEDCTAAAGVDRGVPNQEHCQVIKDAMVRDGISILIDTPYLTPAEKMTILGGHDVILFPEDIKERSK